jgi:hypothetical protein
MMIDTVRGQPRVRAWPAPRGPARTPAQKAAQEAFKEANALAKTEDARIVVKLHEVTQGTPFYPRDLQLMAMFGRLWRMVDRDGRNTRSIAVSKDVSDALDQITDQVGAYLIRGPNGWEGQLSPNGFANWLWTKPSQDAPGTFSTSAFAAKGSRFTVERGMTLFSTLFPCDWVAGADYSVVVARLNPATTVAEFWRSATWSPVTGGTYPQRFDVGVDLNAGEDYAVMLQRTDAAGTYALPVDFVTDPYLRAPMSSLGYARLASTTMSVGDTINTGGGSTNNVYQGLQLAF